MKTYEKPGFNRLAKFLSLFGFVPGYIITYHHTVGFINMWIFSSLLGSFFALCIFFFILLVYWVIDGFVESKNT